MPLMNGQLIFLVMMGLAFSFVPFSLCLLLMHFLMPQAILDRYWKEPHFRPFELMLFSGWSFFAPMRTIMLMWTFMFPRFGSKRGIIEPHRLVPRWYWIAAIVMDIWMIAIFGGVVIISLGFYVYFLVIGDPVGWDEHLAMAIAIACFAFVAIRQWWLNRRDNKAKQAQSQHRKKNKPA